MKKIFVPYDFSRNAADTLVYALQLAEASGSRLTVFHALAISAKIMAAPVTKAEREKVVADEEAAKTALLKETVATAIGSSKIALPEEQVNCRVTFGPIIVETIIDGAIAEKADLIVMGTHGATGVKKFFFGSVTSATISKSDVPVLAIPEGYAFSPVKTLIYSSDLENFESELKRIIPLSKALGSTIKVLHFDYAINRQNQAAGILQKYAADNVELIVKKADANVPLLKQVRAFLVESKPDALVMFTQERSMWDKLFIGSKTEDMATNLQIPLLSFKKEFNS